MRRDAAVAVRSVGSPVAGGVAASRFARRKPEASTARAQRKNPFAVLGAMLVVGGLLGVAGLPAYATTTGPPPVAGVPTAGEQAVRVSSAVSSPTPGRDGFTATTPEQLAQQQADAARASAVSAYLESGARQAGDDYPWPTSGGGLSPLGYYYGECVDFVAWRLNRDAGASSAPYKWVWASLTPTGGSGGQWLYAWQASGWPVSNTPIPGSVAVTGYNHVAYVKQVNDDGTVTVEEYNYSGYHRYGQRIISDASVTAFLYPPG